MAEIRIVDICPMAMTEEQGFLVRSMMAPAIEKNEPIILDFEGISLFATMFFNVSIGYYVVAKGVDYCEQNIKLKNISDLGKETYAHSFQNAREIAETEVKIDNNIVEKNIEES